MRLLRQYLMPESAQADNPALTLDAMQAWLAKLPLTKPLDAATAIADQAARVRARETNVRKRIRLYDLLYETAAQVLPQIEEKLGRASLPLSPQADALIEQANRLLKEFGHGYTTIAVEVSSKWLGLGFAKPLRTATLRGLASHARRLMLAYRVYSGGSPSAWAAMHRLYRIARDGGFASEHIDNGNTVEQQYRRALLMALADPARLGPGELDRVRFYIERNGELAVLSDAASTLTGKAASGGLFVIGREDTVAGRSLAKWHAMQPTAQDLILDCSALTRTVGEHVKGLESNIVPAQLGLPLVARQPQYLAMLKSMMGGWGAPAMRKYHRARFHPRVDLVAGFEFDVDLPRRSGLSPPANRTKCARSRGRRCLRMGGPQRKPERFRAAPDRRRRHGSPGRRTGCRTPARSRYGAGLPGPPRALGKGAQAGNGSRGPRLAAAVHHDFGARRPGQPPGCDA